ncbi:tyrosine-protein phosphatase, partial [Rhizobium ruizarguesonis]
AKTDDLLNAKRANGSHIILADLRAFHSDRNLPGLDKIKLVGVPMKTWHIEDEDIIEALRAIRNAEKLGPVILHCQHGADRTGVVT